MEVGLKKDLSKGLLDIYLLMYFYKEVLGVLMEKRVKEVKKRRGWRLRRKDTKKRIMNKTV